MFSRPWTSLVVALGLLATTAPADAINLNKIATRSSLNNFTAGDIDAGCDTPSGPPFPERKVFAVEDIVCDALAGVQPLANDEKYRLAIVDGPACSGRVAFTTTFGSLEGLRYSPHLPFYAGPDMSVRVRRTSSLNGETVNVHCTMTGTYVPAP